MQRQVVAGCRRCNDAEEHLRVLRHLMPGASYAVSFAGAEGNRV